MPLNIDWQQILLHLFNFVILFAVLYFLLYKPVKQFMDKRTEHYQAIDDEAKEKLAHAEQAEAEHMRKASAAETEITAQKEKAYKELEGLLATRKKQAEDEAAKIIADARNAAEREREKILKEAQGEIAEMVTTAAEKIVSGGDTSDTFNQFLSTVQRGESNE